MKPKFLQWFAYDSRIVGADCSGMSGDQEATYHRLMRYLWDVGPQIEPVLRGRSFGHWDAISHCFTPHKEGLSLSWLEEYRAKARSVSDRQKENRLKAMDNPPSNHGSTTVQPPNDRGTSMDVPSREDEEEDKEEKKKVKRSATASARQRPSWRLAKEVRVAAFIEACKEAVAKNPDRIEDEERKKFFDYWTEGDEGGKMLFEMAKVFDHGRRMDRWMISKTERKAK